MEEDELDFERVMWNGVVLTSVLWIYSRIYEPLIQMIRKIRCRQWNFYATFRQKIWGCDNKL